MRFAELHTGQTIETGSYLVTEEELLRFAEAYDPQWFHVDPEAASKGRFGGLIASGWHTCAIAMRLGVDAALKDSDSFASPGVERIRWLAPVRPGDRLSLTFEVTGKRRSEKQPGLGILSWRWRMFNQNAEEVLELTATSLFDVNATAR